MGLFDPEPEEDEEPPQAGSAAMLLPQSGGQAPQQSPVPYLISSQGAANPAQPQQAPQPTPQAIPAPSTPQPAPILLPSVPQAPAIPNYQPLIDKKADDGKVDRAANAPKWWERVVGGLVGAGVGYKEGPSAGIKAGGAITTRRYDNAVADSAQKVSADNGALQDMQSTYDTSRKGYEDQMTGFNGGMKVADAQQSQQNSDRNFNRDTANDTFNQTRDTSNDQRGQENVDRNYNFEKQIHDDQQKQVGTSNGFERQRIGIEQMKANKEKAVGDSPLSSLTANQKRLEDERHDLEYKQQQDSYVKAKNYAAGDAEALQAAESDNIAARNNLQDRWNQRYLEIYPQGRPSAKGGTPATPQAATPAAPTVQTNTPPPAAPQKAVSLTAAMALPMNKGKSSQQVTQDLQSRQYKVLP